MGAILELIGLICVIIGILALCHIVAAPAVALLIIGGILILVAEFLVGGYIRSRWPNGPRP